MQVAQRGLAPRREQRRDGVVRRIAAGQTAARWRAARRASPRPKRRRGPGPGPRRQHAAEDVRSRGERLPHSLEPVRQPRPLDGRLRLAHPGIGSRESTPTRGEDLHGIPPPGSPCPVRRVGRRPMATHDADQTRRFRISSLTRDPRGSGGATVEAPGTARWCSGKRIHVSVDHERCHQRRGTERRRADLGGPRWGRRRLRHALRAPRRRRPPAGPPARPARRRRRPGLRGLRQGARRAAARRRPRPRLPRLPADRRTPPPGRPHPRRRPGCTPPTTWRPSTRACRSATRPSRASRAPPRPRRSPRLPERWQLVLWHTEVEGDKPADIAPDARDERQLGLRARLPGPRGAAPGVPHPARRRARGRHLPVDPRPARRLRPRRAARAATPPRSRTTSSECRACMAIYLELTEVNSNLGALLAPLLLGGVAAAYLGAAAAGGSLPVGHRRCCVGPGPRPRRRQRRRRRRRRRRGQHRGRRPVASPSRLRGTRRQPRRRPVAATATLVGDLRARRATTLAVGRGSTPAPARSPRHRTSPVHAARRPRPTSRRDPTRTHVRPPTSDVDRPQPTTPTRRTDPTPTDDPDAADPDADPTPTTTRPRPRRRRRPRPSNPTSNPTSDPTSTPTRDPTSSPTRPRPRTRPSNPTSTPDRRTRPPDRPDLQPDRPPTRPDHRPDRPPPPPDHRPDPTPPDPPPTRRVAGSVGGSAPDVRVVLRVAGLGPGRQPRHPGRRVRRASSCAPPTRRCTVARARADLPGLRRRPAPVAFEVVAPQGAR